MSKELFREQIPEYVNERRRQQRAVLTRERILEVAYKEFAEFGFEGTSTRTIAAKAGVNHPLVTYHFKNKEGLWRAVMTVVGSNFTEKWQAQLGSQDAKFSFKAGGASGADALVQSTVATPGDSQSVGYRLGKVGNDWKIYDIDMSGAWLIQVYQGQFKSQLASGGIDGLITYLQKHNSRTN